MRLWQDGIIALLAAIGFASILWGIIRAFLSLPIQRQDTLALICARGDGETLEEQIRTLILLRRERGIVGEILLIDCGLTEEGKKLCQLLQKRNCCVSLCRIDDIQKYIR
ncbi:MAG: hypothetical protein IJ955_01045 [Oscillospiraceae bacterium]|nr:hypothetical protein [Oscillospiraceae bacterium]